MADNNDFCRIPAICVNQPIGQFYIAALPVPVLLATCYSERLVAEENELTYNVKWAQRDTIKKRLEEIAAYLKTEEASIPNSIILGANVDRETGNVIDDQTSWRIEGNDEHQCVELVIPSNAKITSIIDGQHRLFGFSGVVSDVSAYGTD
jgi:DGQHR domain-containing protein